jgi:hypothetical protein
LKVKVFLGSGYWEMTIAGCFFGFNRQDKRFLSFSFTLSSTSER